jgi:putative transposase
MVDIVALLPCLRPHVTATTVRQLSRIIVAMVAMTGRVTMVGIARWAGKGGSYRTTQRFFATVIPWGILFWAFFRRHVHGPSDVYLVAGDEVSSPKPGSARMAWIVSLRACTASQCPGWPSSPCLS